jgi:hypothetical protein
VQERARAGDARFFSLIPDLDAVDAFHSAYKRGRLVAPPQEYADLILVPALLHIDPLVFAQYPPLLKMKMRVLLLRFLGAGQLSVFSIQGNKAQDA